MKQVTAVLLSWKRKANMPLIIEHLDAGDIPRAKKFVDDVLKKGGY